MRTTKVLTLGVISFAIFVGILYCCFDEWRVFVYPVFTGKLYKQTLKEDAPWPVIDIVYTWVNGSDPRLRENLAKVKMDAGIVDETSASTSRFQDNKEFQFSLRSLEKFAPWVRHIFLVTNGQIPDWLNVDTPYLTVIPHDQIYTNKSHLPTFSSPSIETHLHSIEGLSQHFIYFNDDVMLGNYVYPDDFYTNSEGTKIYLSWGVPKCADGCHGGNLGDGTCDPSCNNTMCKFDMGDCDPNREGGIKMRHAGKHPPTPSPTPGPSKVKKNYCTKACPDSWVGDKHCDSQCNIQECAFDGGDCGIEMIYKSLLGFNIANTTKLIELPSTIEAVYFNFSAIINSSVITDGAHDNGDLIRTASISQKYKTMILTFHKEKEKNQIASLFLTYIAPQSEKEIEISFNISTSELPLIATPPPPPLIEFPATNPPSPHDFTAAGLAFGGLPIQLPNIDNNNIDNTNNEKTIVISGAQTATSATSSHSENDNNNSNNNSKEKEKEKNGTAPWGGHFYHPTNTQTDGDNDAIRSILMNMINEIESTTSIRIATNSTSPSLSSPSLPSPSSTYYTADAATEVNGENQITPTRDVEEEKKRKENSNVVSRNLLSLLGGHRFGIEAEDEGTERSSVYIGRKLMDTYGDSLKHVDVLYTSKYGFQSRKVPAHMPHMINKKIFRLLLANYPDEFEKTSSNQLRASDDMQFAFAYFYFIVHYRPTLMIPDIFSYLDVDHDQYLNENELRTAAIRAYGNNLGKSSVFETLLDEYRNITGLQVQVVASNDTAGLNSNYTSLGKVMVDQNSLALNVKFTEKLLDYYSTKLKFKFQNLNTDEVGFVMVDQNDAQIQSKLDGIREKQHKFVCLNDNMNHSDPNSVKVVQMLHDFYNSLVPITSKFELPSTNYNSILYIDEITQLLIFEKRVNFGILVTVYMIVFTGSILFLNKSKNPPTNEKHSKTD